MATKRLPMRKAKEILRLKWTLQRSHREICRALGVSSGAVTGALDRARAAGLTWEEVGPLSEEQLEVIDDRTGHRSTIITSQLPVSVWHDHIGDPTVADAVCDRLLHRAHRIELKGPSRRRTATAETENEA